MPVPRARTYIQYLCADPHAGVVLSVSLSAPVILSSEFVNLTHSLEIIHIFHCKYIMKNTGVIININKSMQAWEFQAPGHYDTYDGTQPLSILLVPPVLFLLIVHSSVSLFSFYLLFLR